MTKEWKDKLQSWSIGAFIGILSSLAAVSYSFKGEDSRELKKTIDRKADIEYVDRKCLEVKEEAKQDKNEILMRIGELQQQNNQLFQQNSEIYQVLIQKK